MGVLGMTIDAWTALGLGIFSFIVTVLANWIVAGLKRPRFSRESLGVFASSLVFNLLWILLVFVSGVIATRYIERITHPVLGYLVFAIVALLLSLFRARLQRRVVRQIREESQPGRPALPRGVLHGLTYMLFAMVFYLALSWLLGCSVELILLVPLWFGALLPDLDKADSVLGRLLPFVSRRLEARFGHQEEWHTAAAAAFVALISAVLIPIIGLQAWYLIALGFTSHLVLDLLTPKGLMLFWPVTRSRYSIGGGSIQLTRGRAEGRLRAALAAIAAILLLLVVGIGPPPPPPAPVLSYEQTVERYYSMRGSNLVFAHVAGAWQATGQRVNGRFEILNAAGDSFVMVDRYSSKVFTAGRSADDNLYLDRISLQSGPSISVKPVEIHLEEQRLLEALSILYEMQREPGLEHIYVSGDVAVAPLASDAGDPKLQVDYAQTSLRRIQSHEDGHYTLHYLTATDVIELANLEVETADLVFVATYSSPAAGPTVTPLPSPPLVPEPGS